MSISLGSAIDRVRLPMNDDPENTQVIIDETVHDAVFQLNGERLNESVSENEREQMLTEWEQQVSNINNEGWESQVTFLFNNGFFTILESNI